MWGIGRSVGIVRLRTQAIEFSLVLMLGIKLKKDDFIPRFYFNIYLSSLVCSKELETIVKNL
jgi:hypothetical protein